MQPATVSPPHPLLADLGVHLIGDYAGQTALCQCGREMVEAVRHLQIPYEALDLPLSPNRMPPSRRFAPPENNSTPPRSPLSIISWNGDAYNIIGQSLPASWFQDRRIVGVWYWETEQEPPPAHREGYQWVDEVWVTSQFIADSLSRTAPVPVRKFPHLMKPLVAPDPLDLPEPLQNDRFVFLFSFDFRSVTRRKNPHAVCESFIRAFPSPSPTGPLCVIKSIAGQSDHELEFLEITTRYRHRPDILFLDGWMTPVQRDSLMARANCYVSLHRSEGLGLTLMESMSLGKPCIATGYSGNLEFMTPENSWLIPYQTVAVGAGALPYPPHHTWAEPDIPAAAAAMKEVFSSPNLALSRGLLGQATIHTRHGVDAVAARLLELMTQAMTAPVRVKRLQLPEADSKSAPPDASSTPASGTASASTKSGREKAYQLIKDAKALEKAARQQRKALPPNKVPPQVEAYLHTLEQLVQVQSKIHSATLHDLGEVKARVSNYHGEILDSLIRDRELMKSILLHLAPKLVTTTTPPFPPSDGRPASSISSLLPKPV